MSLQLGAVGRGERKDLRYLIKIGVRVPCRATPCATHKNATLIWIGSGFRAPGASPSAGLGFAERPCISLPQSSDRGYRFPP